MEKKVRENIGWIDLLRVIACFLVVFSHCCDPFVAQFDADRESFLTGVFCGSLVRPCVPLFVMMTGVLLFPVNDTLSSFYKKRIGRIIPPLIFWSIALPLLFFIYLTYVNPGTANPAIASEHTLQATLTKFFTFLFNFNYDTTPLWYLYMLIGLYLVMPIVSVWMQQASKKDMQLFLIVWGAALLIPYIEMAAPLLGYAGNYGNFGIWGVCDWNDYGMFYYFSGFVGYLVLAHYLMKYPLQWSWKKMLFITVPMFVVGYLITSVGYVLTQAKFPGNYAYLEIVWYFAGINVFMMTFAFFVIVQKLQIRSRRWLSALASLTFGIYLCHFVFMVVSYDLFDLEADIPYVVRILLMAVTTFVISAVLTYAMKKVRFLKVFVS